MKSYSPNRDSRTLLPAVALAALFAVVAVPSLSTSHLYAATPEHIASVTVRSGESLWEIAARHTESGEDVQSTVDTIIATNHLAGSGLVPGQHLRIPTR